MRPRARVNRDKIELQWHEHDLRHEGACRLLGDGVEIRIIQLMLGHSDIKTTQRYLNITDEELRKTLTRLRTPQAVEGSRGIVSLDFRLKLGSHAKPPQFVRQLSVAGGSVS